MWGGKDYKMVEKDLVFFGGRMRENIDLGWLCLRSNGGIPETNPLEISLPRGELTPFTVR